MSMKEQIDKAIGAHGLWKTRLANAIQTGKSEFKPESVAPDNQCDFGKWFYSLPENVRNSLDAKEIKELHAKFHKLTADILKSAVNGDPQKAIEACKPGTEYMKLSMALVSKLMMWKTKVD